MDESEDNPAVELRQEYADLVLGMLTLNAKIDEKLKALEDKERRHHAHLEKIRQNMAAAREKVEFNVGGRLFAVSKATLLKEKGTYFHALLCGGSWKPGDDGAYFIDRDPNSFERILSSLRFDCPVDCSGLSVQQLELLLGDMDYYQVHREVTNLEQTPTSVKNSIRWINLQNNLSKRNIRWDRNHSSMHLSIGDDGRTINMRHSNRWCKAVADAPDVPSFRVRIHQSHSSYRGIMIGYTKKKNHQAPLQSHLGGKGGFTAPWETFVTIFAAMLCVLFLCSRRTTSSLSISTELRKPYLSTSMMIT